MHRLSNARHFLAKLRSTLSTLWCLGMARTFGRYTYSVGGGEFDYAIYWWRGRPWAFPTGPTALCGTKTGRISNRTPNMEEVDHAL